MTRRRPRAAPPPRCSDAHAAAITRELGRLVLGGRGPARPELLWPVAPDQTAKATAGLHRLLAEIDRISNTATAHATTHASSRAARPTKEHPR